MTTFSNTEKNRVGTTLILPSQRCTSAKDVESFFFAMRYGEKVGGRKSYPLKGGQSKYVIFVVELSVVLRTTTRQVETPQLRQKDTKCGDMP